MISIVICSVSDNYLVAVKENIFKTIEIPYELIIINNEKNEYSLAKAYNEGAKRSQYSYLCFLHEDIQFITQGWGRIVLNYLDDPKVGLIGIAGGLYKSIIPSSWSEFQELRAVNIFQYHKFSKEGSFIHIEKPTADKYVDVVAVDGVFMLTKKSIWEQNNFDESLLKGFHGYDIDFSLQIHQHYKIKVIFDVLIEHFSEGNQNEDWLENAIKVSSKWRKTLPKKVVPLSKDVERRLHVKALFNFYQRLSKFHYPFFKKVKLIFKFGFLYFPSAYTLRKTFKMYALLFKDIIKKVYC